VADINQFATRSASNSFEVFNRGVEPSGLVLSLTHDRQTTPASCGAHALASIVNYWRGPGAVTGDALFTATPPTDAAAGYSLNELLTLARGQGLQANAARLSQADIIAELERGRPVLIPLRIPGAYIEPRTLPGASVPLVGTLRNAIIDRAGRLSEMTGMGLASHYMVVIGYDGDRFVVLEPIQGYRTISFARLARYREPFNNAALVFSYSAPAAIAPPTPEPGQAPTRMPQS
jgi:predicted double-glycine peptidase